jgi:putative membrane protein
LGWCCCPVAALLDVGGLWLLYRSRLFAAAEDRPGLHAVEHLHVLAAGILFTTAICQVEPLRHRYGMPLRCATLVVAGAAHEVLAKVLWAGAPPGTAFPPADLYSGAQLMFYGGDGRRYP